MDGHFSIRTKKCITIREATLPSARKRLHRSQHWVASHLLLEIKKYSTDAHAVHIIILYSRVYVVNSVRGEMVQYMEEDRELSFGFDAPGDDRQSFPLYTRDSTARIHRRPLPSHALYSYTVLCFHLYLFLPNLPFVLDHPYDETSITNSIPHSQSSLPGLF